jgi:DNA-binding winged helix-turn-helix (wHTH) protein/tetratricopeptide (TPR) repeat protein
MEQPTQSDPFGPFRLDAAKLVLWRNGEVVSLPPKAVALLAALVRAAGDVVTKDELIARVWPDVVVEESNLTVTMSGLRKSLGLRPDGKPYIETLSRRGYRFCPTPPEATAPSLGVLPFRCLGGGADKDGLGMAMADAVITRLAGTGRVLVRPTSAVARYARRAPDPREAGRELQVAAVLEGHYQLHGDRLRVTVQLVPTEKGSPSWSGRFEGRFADLFAMQDALADELAGALRLELDARERSALRVRPTQNLEAYQAFARGAHFWFRLTTPALLQSIGCFDEALSHDPAYALAHVGKASAHLALAVTGGMVPEQAWPLAEEAARRAVGAGRPLAVAHVADAYLKAVAAWDWAGAEAAMRRALDIDPRSLNAHQWNALLLCCQGRLEEAAESAARALAQDPVSVVAHGLVGLRFTLAGDDRRALEAYSRVVELRPEHLLGHWGRGVACVRLGRADEGLDELRRTCELSGGNPALCAYLAWGLAATGRAEEARSLLAQIEASPAAYVSPYQLAAVHAALGERGRALERLGQAADERDPWIVLLRVDPKLAPLRRLAAFRELERRVFGPAYPAPARRGQRHRLGKASETPQDSGREGRLA